MFSHAWHRSLFLSVFLAGTLLLAGCEDKTPPPQAIPVVTYLQLDPQSVTLTTELSGRTSSFTVSEVRPQVSGIILERLFVEGSDVKQGDVLYQIDPALYQAAYDNAKATLMKAEANAVAAKLLAERYQQVVKVNAVSKQEYDNAVASYGQAEAEVAAARAALDTASINLAYTKVTAPISGRIGRSTVTPGALVTQNQATPLATVQQLNPVYVDVTQSSSELLRLRRAFASGVLKFRGEEALQATLKLEDGTPYMQRVPQKDPESGAELKDAEGNILYEIKPVTGMLKFSEVTVEQSTGVVTIRAVFPNPDGLLLPGMYVRAVLEEGLNENAFLVPQKTVVRNNRGQAVAQLLTKNATIQDQQGVYIVQSTILEIDRPIGNNWLVTGGVKAGDLVVVDGLQKIRPGMTVRGAPDQSSAPKQDAGADGKAAAEPAAAEPAAAEPAAAEPAAAKPAAAAESAAAEPAAAEPAAAEPAAAEPADTDTDKQSPVTNGTKAAGSSVGNN